MWNLLRSFQEVIKGDRLGEKSLNMICYGININPSKKLFPLSSHYGEKIFNTQKLLAHAIDEDAIIYETFVYESRVEGESLKEAAIKLGASFTVEGSYGFKCGAAISGSIVAEMDYSIDNKEARTFSQIRKLVQFAKFQVPIFREKLRSFLTEEVRHLIDNIDSIEKAQKVINLIGPLYISKASFGGLLTLSSSNVKNKSSHSLYMSMQAEYEYVTTKAKGSAKFNVGSNTGQVDKNITFTVSSLGGDPRKILNGDESGWIESTHHDLACIDAVFAPICYLASESSQAEQLLIKALTSVFGDLWNKLESMEVNEVNTNIPLHKCHPGGKFALMNMESGKYLSLRDGGLGDGTRVTQFGESTNNMDCHWIIHDIPHPQYILVGIQSEKSKRFLNVDNGKQNNGTIVHTWGTGCEGHWNRFILHYMSDNVVAIQAQCSDKHLNLDLDHKNENGAKVHLWGGSDSRKWSLNQWELVPL